MLDRTKPLTAVELLNRLPTDESETEDGSPMLPIPGGITPKTIPGVEKAELITPYRNAHKQVLFYIVRLSSKKGKKSFPWCWWRHSDGREEWKSKRPLEKEIPLLNLPNIINNTDKSICVGEGEKCAKALQKLFPDSIATTSCGGANAAAKTDWSTMSGRDVILFLDNDEAGENYGRDVYQLCKQAGAKSIKQYNMQVFAQYAIENGKIVERVRALPDKYDIADALEEGWTAELLKKLEEILQQKGLPVHIDYPEPICDALLNNEEEDEWPEPLLIKPELLPVESFHSQLLPASLCVFVEDIAHRMQRPMEFVAIPTMVMFGSLIGAGCGIMAKQKDDWLTIPNIWGGIIGRPGSSKSPSLLKALKPLIQLEGKAQEKYKLEKEEYLKKLEAYKITKDMIIGGLKKKHKSNDGSSVDLLRETQQTLQGLQEPEEPICRRFKINDSTIEKIGELLSQNPRGLLCFRDELIGFLVTLDKENHVSDRAFFLESWSGNSPFTTDRILRGRTHCDNLCLSILGGTQPSKLLGYLHKAVNNIENDGLMQRFQLLVYPDEKPDWNLVDEHPNQSEQDHVLRIAEKIASMDFTEYGAAIEKSVDIPSYHFAADAQDFFNVWLTELEGTKLRNEEDEPIILEHLSKYPKLFLALALIFHIIDLVDGRAKGQVALESAERAAAWCDYLESHARRIYGMALDKTHATSALSKKIKKRSLNDGFTAREVYRKKWSMLTTTDDVQDACEELVDAGWLREQYIESPFGKGKTVYLINPKIWSNYE